MAAAVLTYRRPRLATQVVRSLLDDERLAPSQITVVVNGDGGLNDPEVASRVRIVRLPRNLGPAGGFRACLEEAFADSSTRWAYLCEDDLGLYHLGAPRLGKTLARIEELAATEKGHGEPRRIGAVVVAGRRFVGRGAHTENVVPIGGSFDLVPVDVAGWGGMLVSRHVYEAGIMPDAEMFFGLEDFDFTLRMRRAGFELLLDSDAARTVASLHTLDGRDKALRGQRPTDADEPWREYYHARNTFTIIRRYGKPSWYAWHLAFSLRRLERARNSAARRAIIHGLWEGLLGRQGMNPRYQREIGEL